MASSKVHTVQVNSKQGLYCLSALRCDMAENQLWNETATATEATCYFLCPRILSTNMDAPCSRKSHDSLGSKHDRYTTALHTPCLAVVNKNCDTSI